ncbi:hypothetical protein [Granulicella sibirica]|uniref:Uncharacterized protein n=1 Tax=Granulicella sibirica TaxID=2479048 RepID=A0A4Q0T8F1_9BACT|nr:hypothetical protein [Granulicella sibirica]RXH57996.1 hypothetical protein GRAN_1306 [Granulicella sibirica]
MKTNYLPLLALLTASTAFAQVSRLAPGTTLPITFDHGIDASRAHAGDTVSAHTTQLVQLADGRLVSAGAHVTGHVLAADAFHFDTTHYATQSPSNLAIRFDTLDGSGVHVPLTVYVRALADPTTVWDAARPQATDMDPRGTTTQIGGDQVTPSQDEVLSSQGDIVGYRHHGGVYAHLLSASGGCSAGNTEQPVGAFSASACGLYGFTGSSLTGTGRTGEPSTLALTSTHSSPKIWAHSAALLEVIPQTTAVAAR